MGGIFLLYYQYTHFRQIFSGKWPVMPILPVLLPVVARDRVL
jgi:hypothetical protein